MNDYSVEIELTLFVIFGLACAFAYLIWGLSTVKRFNKAKQLKKWAKEELDRGDGEQHLLLWKEGGK